MSDFLKQDFSFSLITQAIKNKTKKKEAASSSEAEPVIPEVFVPRTPEVNMLPSYVTDKYHVSALTKRFGAGVAVVAIVFSGIFIVQTVTASNNTETLNELNTQNAALNTQTRSLRVYEQYQNGVLEKRTTLGETLASDVGLGNVGETLNAAARANQVSLNGLTITVSTDPTASSACVNPDPFTEVSSIGCVTFTGSASSSAGAAGFLEAMEQIPGLVNPYIPSFTSGEDNADSQISGTVAFNEEFQTQRFGSLLEPYTPEQQAAVEGGNS